MTRATPIMFTDGRAQLVALGDKTQTRRVSDPDRKTWSETKCPYGTVGDLLWVKEGFAFEYHAALLISPQRAFPRQYSKDTHDVVYREDYHGCSRWLRLTDNHYMAWEPAEDHAWDATEVAGHSILEIGVPWKSPRWMPRWASRTTLEITSVILERRTTISHDDAIAEGFESAEAFEATWRRMHGERADLRWAITFQRVGYPLTFKRDEP